MTLKLTDELRSALAREPGQRRLEFVVKIQRDS